ncbi:MAG: hypothetical protein GOU98_04205 [Candidatus Altiarchaeota archaeon]|nr:hypothetical protein [Candidatus Altiarchaeota archaeon]
MDISKLKKEGKVAEVKDEKMRAFDIAYAGERAYLIKVVHNIESVSGDFADTIKKCASVVGAEPLVISHRGKETLKENVIYSRHGVPVMREETFMSLVHGDRIGVADRGGIKIPIKDLRPLMKEFGMSRITLAKLLETSTEMVRKYEGGSAPGEEIAKRLIEIFGTKILSPHRFDCVELKRAFIGKAPIDMAIKKKKTLLISFDSSKQRIENLKNVSEVLDAEPVVGKKLEDIDLD